MKQITFKIYSIFAKTDFSKFLAYNDGVSVDCDIPKFRDEEEMNISGI